LAKTVIHPIYQGIKISIFITATGSGEVIASRVLFPLPAPRPWWSFRVQKRPVGCWMGLNWVVTVPV